MCKLIQEHIAHAVRFMSPCRPMCELQAGDYRPEPADHWQTPTSAQQQCPLATQPSASVSHSASHQQPIAATEPQASGAAQPQSLPHEASSSDPLQIPSPQPFVGAGQALQSPMPISHLER